jgi:hypothetical protein
MLHDNDNKCTCAGPICSCGARGVVKDGAGVRVPASMMDSATGNLTVDGVTIDRATWDAYTASPERAYDEHKHRTAHAHLGDRAPAFTGEVAGRFLADRVRTSKRIQENVAHAQSIAANPTAYARNGRLLSELRPGELAREEMIRGYSNRNQ